MENFVLLFDLNKTICESMYRCGGDSTFHLFFTPGSGVGADGLCPTPDTCPREQVIWDKKLGSLVTVPSILCVTP
jgi:hypothetical protein